MKLYDYSLKTFGKLEGLTYHHIHFPIWVDVEIEAHTWPSFFVFTHQKQAVAGVLQDE